jgi:hypothetical protein
MIHQRHNSNKFVPGVGAYKDIDLAYNHFIIKERTSNAIISKTQFKRYPDHVASTKSWVPGPGSYEIIPIIKTK